MQVFIKIDLEYYLSYALSICAVVLYSELVELPGVNLTASGLSPPIPKFINPG